MAGRGHGHGGVGRATEAFYARHRVLLHSLILSIVGIATGAATTASVRQGYSLMDVALLVGGAILAAGTAAIYTRKLGLGLIAGVVPLFGLAWAAPMSAGSTFGVVPLLAYAFGYSLAVMLIQNVLRRELGDDAMENPRKAAIAAAGLLAVFALLWFWNTQSAAAAYQATVDILGVIASTLMLVPIGVSFLHFDESYVAEANRVGERRQRLLEKLAMVAVPRWGMSIAGICIIFLAMAWFGAQPTFVIIHGASVPVIAVVSVGVVFLIATTLCGGWREGFAVTIVAGLVWLSTLWSFALLGGARRLSLVGAAELVVLLLFLALIGARRAQAYVVQRDNPAIARLRAVEDAAPSQIFASLGALAALAPSIAVHHAYGAYAVGLIFAAVGAIAFVPALATACELLLPRRQSVEEIYRRH